MGSEHARSSLLHEPGPYSEGGGVTGVEPLPENFCTKILGLPFCWNVEHVQLKNVVVTQFTCSLMAMTVDLLDAILAGLVLKWYSLLKQCFSCWLLLDLCWCHIVTITVGLKRPPECIKMHHFEGEIPIFFWGGATAPSLDPTPVGAFSASIRVIPPTPLTNHISGTGLTWAAVCNARETAWPSCRGFVRYMKPL